MLKQATLGTLAVLLITWPAFGQDKLPAGAKVAKLEFAPAAIELKTPFEYRQLLITGVLESGERVDLTRSVKVDAPKAVRVSADEARSWRG